jgi:hypothetical protein
LKDIKEELPDELQLTSINTENHVYETPSTTSRTYYLIHAILQLSTAYLYPEYLPTYGFRLKKPQGPMDAPLVTDPVPQEQPNYWEDKAKECFEYVRDFVSMLRSFKDRDLVVESPFIAHAVYKAAWCGKWSSVLRERKLSDVAMYCFHVPKMDPSRALDAKLEPNAWDTTNQVLGSMRRKFKLVNGMSRNLATVASIYTDRLREWRNSGGTPTSTFSDSDGGLNEYAEKFERAHKQFGSFEHDQEDLAYPTDKPYSRLKHEEDLSDPASAQSPVASFKTESEEPRRSTSSRSGFTPVNPDNAATIMQVQQSNNNVRAPYSAQPMYSPPTSQAPQQSQASQPYPAQTLPYEQSPGYGYSSTTPTFPQTATYHITLKGCRNWRKRVTNRFSPMTSSSTRMRAFSKPSNGRRKTVLQSTQCQPRSIGQANRLRTHHTLGSGPASNLQSLIADFSLSTSLIETASCLDICYFSHSLFQYLFGRLLALSQPFAIYSQHLSSDTCSVDYALRARYFTVLQPWFS